MPNSSARCAQLPRAVDKVPFYAALKKFRDYLRGDLPELDEADVVFPEVKLQNFNNKRIKDEVLEPNSMDHHHHNSSLLMEGDSRDGLESRVDPDTGKKRRGRPPKPRPDGSLPPPKRKRVDDFGNPLPKGSNPIDPITGKKKRGRPKKTDLPPSMGPVVHHGHHGGGSIGHLGMMNGGLSNKSSALSDYGSRPSGGDGGDGTDSDAPSSSSKTPTRLPPFSPNFARGGPLTGGGGGDDGSSDCGGGGGMDHPRPASAAGGPRSLDLLGRSSLDGDGGGDVKDLSRADSLPDLSGRLGGGVPPPQQQLHNPHHHHLHHQQQQQHHGTGSPVDYNHHHGLDAGGLDDETTSQPDDQLQQARPDSARSLSGTVATAATSRGGVRLSGGGNNTFSNPTTPVDGHSAALALQANYSGQQQQSFPSSFPPPLKSPSSSSSSHHSPNNNSYPQNFHAPYRSLSHMQQGTPPPPSHHHLHHHHPAYDSPPMRGGVKPPPSHDADVTSKSLTGLESLVDQIPAIAETDSGVYSGSGGSGSHPATPRSVGPYSPGGGYPGSGGSSYLTGGGSYAPESSSYPTDLSTSTNNSYNSGIVATTAASHSPVTTPSNFSVSSLAHSSRGDSDSIISGGGLGNNDAFSVSSLAASSYAAAASLVGDQSPPGSLSSNPYMSNHHHPHHHHHSSMFGAAAGLMSARGISQMAATSNYLSASSSMAGMAGMAGMYGMSNYQYSSAGAAYSAQAFAAAAASGSSYPPPHGLHMPNPGYPYPSPYTQSPYSQSPYF
jgi:hypothetical protein